MATTDHPTAQGRWGAPTTETDTVVDERRNMVDSAGTEDETGSPEPGAGPSTGVVLVVEDDPGTLRFVTLALQRAGFTVVSVTSAPPALDLLSEQAIDVLLADIGLPGMSGFDLITEARRRHPDLAIALMTADASVDTAAHALRSEVDDFLTKPVSPTTLVAQVRRLVERRSTAPHH
jgi:two-component system C4-dicarboxylate transport response regulator DctD